MPIHREKRVLPYTPEQMFALVADVEKYPEFLPWCVACRIRKQETPASFTADLQVGFKMVREQFTSRVTLERPNAIAVTYLNGPFEHLTNEWKFAPSPKGTEVDFFLSFEFRSRLLQTLIGVLFEEAVHRMVSAFEARAARLYTPIS
ncbi:MAG: type II toxin-antitoxin system RatA family toxin [Rhodospirillaceae bacterium]|nr:type II toxin-antitoxin system RatA family toxin [Rhodospirillaceae bacterium]